MSACLIYNGGMHIFHDWHLWSEPKNREYTTISMVNFIQQERTVTGQIQERTCATCGKYQWRKI